MRHRRESFSKSTRFRVLVRDHFKCQYCGGTAPKSRIVIDHVTPVCLGGTSAPYNLVAACEPCNQGKGRQEVKGWVEARSASIFWVDLNFADQDELGRWAGSEEQIEQLREILKLNDIFEVLDRLEETHNHYPNVWDTWNFFVESWKEESTVLVPGGGDGCHAQEA